MRYADGRPEEVVRLPDVVGAAAEISAATGPYRLYQDYLIVRCSRSTTGVPACWPSPSMRHLCQTRPGCDGVTIHWAPIQARPRDRCIRQSLAVLRRKRVDLDAKEFYDAPEWIGDYPCVAF